MGGYTKKTTISSPYPHGVPCVQGQYSGVTGAIKSTSPPTYVSIGRELELGDVFCTDTDNSTQSRLCWSLHAK